MPRALAAAVGAMLAIAVALPPPPLQGQQTPVQKLRCPRLEEIKVELALLSDIVTFPYAVAASVHEEALQLYGFVPNDMIRQHVLDVARRNTSLMVNDGLGIQTKLSLQQSLRPASVLQQEGSELLKQDLGEMAKKVFLEVRPNGVVVLTGRIDSMERKLEVSRLFRRLSGCGGVFNKLIVEQIVRNGHPLVQVTRDGSLSIPPSALEPGQEAITASATPPIAIPPKQASTPLQSASPKTDNNADEFSASKLPVKWGRPASGWETQVKELETMQAPPKPAAPPAPEPATTWQRIGGSEESEPKSPAPAMDADALRNPPILRSSRRWPPAYVTGSPPAQGRPGSIVFVDDPPPKPALAIPAPSRPIVPAELQRRVQSICGRDAREVAIITQRDGNVLVKVKVANRTIEDQLSRKILDLPDMTSPQVRLLMEVGP
ncbi:MAG TPA: hypothetical protein VMF69_04470 [Gemmataceae bacterium]|nr:hypothetical protein [Gemmataceae bacterium]